MPDRKPALSYAASLLRCDDRERFLTVLFAPADCREDLFALYALNVELSRIREQAREPMAGLIRLQWWRDALLAGQGGAGHPLVAPLREAIRRYHLDPDLLDGLLIARERDFDPDPPADPDDAEKLAAAGPVGLGLLALAILGANKKSGEAERNAVCAVSSAWGVLGHLRSIAYHAALGRVTLPASLLPKDGAVAILAGRATGESLSKATRTMAERAERHLIHARSVNVMREALPALLTAVQAKTYAAALRRSNWNPFEPRIARNRSRPLALAWTVWRGHL
ncbi:phytoene/squalene synthase family protein [Magnetospirillum molischianum]|uniref:Probable Phytoene/squalene synthetase (CrtB) n=1 Tax=Magnetospirillum molischianum DSM 120 TaxID=1150626 RepID=H8FVP8_MAGML|nr:squalene/phytoene synthase family protein [Magnetospirillum molischianum]CCG42436.1 probable Phytoene/squalene synthetase (crtB) [Magnetospirillum molischianum DSM 120]